MPRRISYLQPVPGSGKLVLATVYTAPMQKDWVATVGASESEVSVRTRRQESGDLVVSVGESEAAVDAVRLADGRWSVLIDGRQTVVDIGEHGGRAQLVSRGGVTSVILEDARAKAMAASVAAGRQVSGETLRAPIAGKVVRYFVAEGDTVTAGDPIVVLEAMKMENEIKASVDGTVTAIASEAGASVETRQVLAVIA